MADLVITSANVQIIDGTAVNYNASVAIVAGKGVYLDSSNEAALGNSAAAYTTFGIAVNDGALNQPLTILFQGTIDLGVSLQQGMQYALSPNTGMIAPLTDIVTPQFQNILGYANDLNQLVLFPASIPFALGAPL